MLKVRFMPTVMCNIIGIKSIFILCQILTKSSDLTKTMINNITSLKTPKALPSDVLRENVIFLLSSDIVKFFAVKFKSDKTCPSSCFTLEESFR